jgi:hypothetical protein
MSTFYSCGLITSENPGYLVFTTLVRACCVVLDRAGAQLESMQCSRFKCIWRTDGMGLPRA